MILKNEIDKIKSFIDNHFCEPLSIDSLANRFSISPGYIIQCMKKYYGVTPQKYWARLRLNEAQKLLIKTDLSIYEIAREVGYNNTAYFRSSFRKQVGLTPEDLKNREITG